MQRVDSCFHMPHHCAATLKAEDPKGFLDTGCELPSIDPHIYLSISWLHDNAGLVDLVPGPEFDRAQERIAQLERELEQRLVELESLNRELDAISVIESSDRFKARRKPGPRPKKEKTAA